MIKTINDIEYQKNNTIVIFTEGSQLELNFDNDCKTGKWKVRTNNIPDNIIIYHKNKNDVDSTIYEGSIIKYKSTDIDGRYDIIFNNARTIGHTDSNWHEFMSTHTTSPIVYK